MGLLSGLERFAIEGLRKLTGDAQPGDVRAGKTFSNADGNDKVGTLAERGNGGLVMPGTADQILLAGIYNTDLVVAGDPDLITGNIKAGADVFGVPGKASVVDTVDATAVASSMEAGKTAYVNGAKVAGNLTKYGNSPLFTPGTAEQWASPGIYDNGAGGGFRVAGDPDLIASNIRSGKNIFGINGSLIEGLDFNPNAVVGGTGGGGATTIVNVNGSGYLLAIARPVATSYAIDIYIDGTQKMSFTVGNYQVVAYLLRFTTNLTVKTTDASSGTRVYYTLD